MISQSGFLFLSLWLAFQAIYADTVVIENNRPNGVNGETLHFEKDTFDRFKQSFDEADYQKLNQADRAMALRDAFLGSVYTSTEFKESLTPQQIRNREVFLNQHFYRIPDEERSAIYRQVLPIIAIVGDEQMVEKFFAEANRFSPQEMGKLLCSQIQAMESGVPRSFGEIGKKLDSEAFGNLYAWTQKFSGLTKRDLSVANYECKMTYFDEPKKISQILSTIKALNKKNQDAAATSEKRISKSEIQAQAPHLKDCREKEVRTLISNGINSFSKKSKSGKTSSGYYVGSEQGCQIHGFVTKEKNEFKLYINTYSSHTVKPFIFTDEQDAMAQLKFLWSSPRPSSNGDGSAAGRAQRAE